MPVSNPCNDLHDIKTPWNQPIPSEFQMDNRNLDNLTRRISLLAAAEESFCQAASIIQPAIKELIEDVEESQFGGTMPDDDRFKLGLHLLEEAMAAHNRYMDSLK